MGEYLNLKFAALFKDIGKFYQRAYSNEPSISYDSKYEKLDDDKIYGTHNKWSADFVKDYYNSQIENLVLNHHLNNIDDNMLWILQNANYRPNSDNRIDESKTSNKQLTSIFSNIDILKKSSYSEMFVPLKELDLSEEIYPTPNNTELDYNSLWKKFKNEFESIPNFYEFETVLAIVKKYTYAIPSLTYLDEDDVSLYDDIKTSVALANCNYLFNLEDNDEKNIYTIINGDISGIQNFIYRVSSPKDAQKDMSKRLRGRSLYLTLLSEAITSNIIHSLDLDSTNILFCGGGRFTIIAPNTNQTDECIKRINDDINRFFINEFNAELYLAIESVDASNEDLNNFNDILSLLNAKLSENKKHKFQGKLEELFSLSSKTCKVKDLCHVCGNQTTNESFCDTCESHVNLGRDVANAKYLIKYSGKKLPESSFYNSDLEIGFIFSKKDISKILDKNSDVKFYVYKLNNTEFLEYANTENNNVSFDFKFLGNNVPSINDNILYFEHLAQCSKGSKKLGVLKMDVDNLGKIFSQGFDKSINISKSSSLSFNMDLFFSGLINNIVNEFKVYTDCDDSNNYNHVGKITFENDNKSYDIFKPKNRSDISSKSNGISTIYINYSGGDDLLVVGPYDDIIEFAQLFRDKFKKWTCNNDSINISAGIKIYSSKFPIGKAAIMADNDLEKSKECGRNKITVFNQVLAWHTDGEVYPGFDKIFDFSKKLEELRESGKLSAGFVYSLLHMWEHKTDIGELNEYSAESWEEYNISKFSKKAYVPSLYYKLRIIKNKQLKEELKDELLEFMPWIRVPVSWSSLRLR
ncbi:type III-A CRISPR-associated protein Cas10/Csm1 [Methanobrevibacter millerae]|uniref:CRISPR system single-strand-specific deoxyribonuclease Cas10/Csm1 (subtype III-A) n=1 Tax=Methanobrevibacter millerae TaxID=230361 RepID=A0A0U3DRF8_9EURY|nr:type III-A CRISPR-associated protein Cas10/Csm1 [Methanobrevibacter millerae]ALT68969.1 CRISPR-associated protein Csm1 family [Methanobrevibacter millerae]